MTNKLSNYDNAKIEADKIDAEIISVLKSGRSFRVEAGAGSGKTYSLNNVIEWVQKNSENEYKKNKQNVICITYTNAAVNVILDRIKEKSFILPSTIHSFAWESIKQYQSTLINFIKENPGLHPREGDIESIIDVQYTLGSRYIDDTTLYLHHNDVIALFSNLLDIPKFRLIFAKKYPLIVVDEYQDSFKDITDKLIKYFISENIGPQFGFFGDAWQTIYQSNNACGLIQHENIVEIKKASNFRSAPKIVEVLNKLRPALPQVSAIDDFDGEAIVIHCDDYKGIRRTERNFNGELPVEELKNRIDILEEIIKSKSADNESTKTLMITHKVLANQQGYDQVLDVLGDSFKDADDKILRFFMDIIEPVFYALESSNMQLLFDTLSIKKYPITKKSEKLAWKNLFDDLKIARQKQVSDVINVAVESNLIPVSSFISDFIKLSTEDKNYSYNNILASQVLSINYSQIISAISFLSPSAEYSTSHGVKGEEYDNVIFAIGKGWNNYQFDVYVPMINCKIPSNKINSFERNRNLFYVCCSRPIKKLVIFISIPLSNEFKTFLNELVGCENIFSYSEFLEANSYQ